MSYTGVTVASLLTVELVFFGALGIVLAILLNSGFMQAQLIEAVAIDYTPTLRFYLAQTPPDREGIANWLDRLGAVGNATVPLSFDATDEMLVVGSDGTLLGVRPPDLLGSGQIGQPLDFQAIPELAAPLQAALAGEEDVELLYTRARPGEKVAMTIPIWDEAHVQVLGVLAGLAEVPTLRSSLGDLLPILGVSLLLFTLIAAFAGAVFGFVAAREPVQRLEHLSEATLAWSGGDFSVLVDDPHQDELGQLARRLNEMARQLQHLLDTRRELAIVEERNRLARELHDSAKQQAFAAAAQISTVRTLLKNDPQAAEAHAEEVERLIYDLRQELTTLIQELRPAALEGKGLAAAIRDYATDWARQTGVVLDVRVRGERSLPLDIEQALFRIGQEALANVVRHSEASKAEIALIYTPDRIILTVSDNGRGFDAKGEHRGFGLSSMQQRAESIAGYLTVESVLTKGTTITCTVPLGQTKDNGGEEPHG